MNRRTLVRPLLACAWLAAAASCGPTEQAQTVSFVLALSSQRVSNIRFEVAYDSGKFSDTDGACVVSSAAGPRAAGASEAALREKDAVFGMTRRERRQRTERVVVSGGSVSSSSSSSSTSTSSTTTTTAGPVTTTEALPTTTIAGSNTCGDRVVDDDEQCDDGDSPDGGCDDDCRAEFAFSAVDDDDGTLTIRIVNGYGIPPGSTLVFCKFQGDLAAAALDVTTVSCTLPNGTPCSDPDDDAPVAPSTTTTTTTTTQSTTTTTTGNGASTTSTLEDN